MIGLEGRLRDKPRMRWMVAALVLALLAGCGDSPPPEAAMPPDEPAVAVPPEPNVEAPVADASAEASG
jgi:predicted small lipoprotein YifL